MTLPTGGLGPDASSIVTVSAVVPAVALFGPLLVLGAIAVALSKPAAITSSTQSKEPLFVAPGASVASAAAERVRALTVPDQYRSLFNPTALEIVAAGGRPALWLAALVALVIAVAR